MLDNLPVPDHAGQHASQTHHPTALIPSVLVKVQAASIQASIFSVALHAG